MATSHPSSENEQHDFRNPDELSDVTLIVEGQKLYVHRAYLATWSPIFRRMFISDFQEKNASEVTLPEKRVEEVLDLLRCIYPPQKPITGKLCYPPQKPITGKLCYPPQKPITGKLCYPPQKPITGKLCYPPQKPITGKNY